MLKENPQVEETVIVSDETRALLGIKPKKKRWVIALSDIGREADREAKEQEKLDHANVAKKGRTYVHMLRLADKLDGVGPYAGQGAIRLEKFNLETWANLDGSDYGIAWARTGNFDVNLKGLMLGLEAPKDCGTTACACGWAATDPYFNAIGIRFEKVFGLDKYKAMRAFGLSEERFGYFFFSDHYSRKGTPKLVANRIRHWLASDYFDAVRPT